VPPNAGVVDAAPKDKVAAGLAPKGVVAVEAAPNAGADENVGAAAKLDVAITGTCDAVTAGLIPDEGVDDGAAPNIDVPNAGAEEPNAALADSKAGLALKIGAVAIVAPNKVEEAGAGEEVPNERAPKANRDDSFESGTAEFGIVGEVWMTGVDDAGVRPRFGWVCSARSSTSSSLSTTLTTGKD
jgi:hypothetical protein